MVRNEFKNIYLISYKKNGKWNPIMEESRKRYDQMGFNVKLFEGFSLKEHPEIKPNEVCYRNIQKFFFENKNLTKNKNIKGFLISEDDSFVADQVIPAFLQKQIQAVKDYERKIIRVGYQKIVRIAPTTDNSDGTYVVGTQLLWFPRLIIEDILKRFEERKAQHLNGFLSKDKFLPVELLDKSEQIDRKNKYVLELEHVSTTTGKVRKGKKV
jgi:hypothetical protein